jgi:hypothetical protein
MTSQDHIAIRRLVAIREAYPGVLPMREMIRLCFEVKEPEFEKEIRRLKTKGERGSG